jgi:diguanylate cyclase (GGDEF)-like protein
VVFWLLIAFTTVGQFLAAAAVSERPALAVSTPFALALVFVAGPASAMLPLVAARVAADVLVRRRGWAWAAFNGGQLCISVMVAWLVFEAGRSANGHLFSSNRTLAVGLAAGAAFYLANAVLTASHGDGDRSILVPLSLAMPALGPLVVTLGQSSAWSVVVLLGPLAIAFRADTLARQRHADAQHDQLTGLPNQQWLQSELAACLRRPGDQRIVVAVFDLQDFNELNQALGRRVGDHVLSAVAARLQLLAGKSAAVGRVSGDTFGMVARSDLPTVRAAAAIAVRLRECLTDPVLVADMPIQVRGQVGTAVYPDHGSEPIALLDRADIALHAAKTQHRRWACYTPELDRQATLRWQLASDLRQGLAAGELVPYYQPVIDLRSGQVVGAEALARWNHPGLGLLPPHRFLSIADHTGLMRDLARVMLTRAARQSQRWRRQGFDLQISVNLSAQELYDLDLARLVEGLVEDCELAPGRLVIELTETAIMADAERSLPTLKRLRGLGVSLAVDDYGTGYSSLAYLKRLPITELKIDKSFVVGMDVADTHIVDSTIKLGQKLGLLVAAEGVETTRGLAALRDSGCDRAQGFLFSRALPPDEFVRWTTARTA